MKRHWLIGCICLALAGLAPTARAAERRWSDPVPLLGEPIYYVLAATAVSSSGDTVAVWMEPSIGVWALVQDPSGPVGQAQALDFGYEPDVSTDGAGGATAVWSGAGIYAASLAPAGTFDDPVEVASAGRHPKIDLNEAGAGAVSFGTDSGVKVAFRPAGGSFSAPVTISDPLPMQPQYDRDSAVTSDGRAVVAWIEQPSGQLPRLRAASGSQSSGFSTPVPLSDPTLLAEGAEVAADGEGRAVIVWTERMPEARYGRVRMSLVQSGQAPSPAQNVPFADESSSEGNVGVSAAGEVLVAYVRRTPSTSESGPGVPHVVTAPFGGGFSAPEPLGGIIAGSKIDLAVAPDGQAIAAWEHFGNPSGLETARRGTSGGFGQQQDLRHGCGNGYRSSLAIGPGGEAAATVALFGESGGAESLELVLDTESDASLQRSCAIPSVYVTDPYHAPAPPPPAPPYVPPPPGPVDRTRPIVRLESLRATLRSASAVVGCNENCGVLLKARISSRRGARPFATLKLGAALVAGRYPRIALVLDAKARNTARRLLRRRRSLFVDLRADARDTAGNRTVKRLTGRLKRPRRAR